jgi:hypothetical protein
MCPPSTVASFQCRECVRSLWESLWEFEVALQHSYTEPGSCWLIQSFWLWPREDHLNSLFSSPRVVMWSSLSDTTLLVLPWELESEVGVKPFLIPHAPNPSSSAGALRIKSWWPFSCFYLCQTIWENPNQTPGFLVRVELWKLFLFEVLPPYLFQDALLSTFIFYRRGISRVWTQGLLLPNQVLYHLSHIPAALFAVFFFSDRISPFVLVDFALRSSYIHLLCSWDYRCKLPYKAYFLSWGSNFCFAQAGLELQSSHLCFLHH